MHTQVQLGDIAVDVIRKDIKNVHLSVHPPTGRVTISAPKRLNLDTIRIFAISKLGWIRRQQNKVREQDRETRREFLNRESHYVWGRRCLLRILESDRPPSVELNHSRLVLQVRAGTDRARCEAVLDAWYRGQVMEKASPLIAKWEKQLNVKVRRVFVRRMRTKWGSCNHRAGTIRLNSDLAKKPRSCLEYIVLHEMAHLIEPTHNAHFRSLMDRFMPNWAARRELLNRLPVRHYDWRY